MRKVVAGLFSSIDGVVQAPNEWQTAFDDEMGAALSGLLEEQDAVTTLRYHGELAADLWALGRWWGGVVGRQWDSTVAASLTSIAAEAERRAAARAASRPPEAST